MPFSSKGMILTVSPRVWLPRGWAEEGVWWEMCCLRLVFILNCSPLLALRALCEYLALGLLDCSQT